MRTRLESALAALALGAALALAGACDTSEGAAADAGSSAGKDTGGGDTVATGDTGPIVATPFEDFSNHCTKDADCAASQVCGLVGGQPGGLCLRKPSVESTISDPFTEENTSQKPNLACVDQAWPAPTGAKVKVHGFLDRFGSGGVTEGMTIRIFDASKFNPGRCASMGPAEALACYEEVIADTAAILGQTISTRVPDLKAEGTDCDETPECPLGFECNDAQGFFACREQYGLYEIDGIPTNTPLVIMTAPPDDEKDSWHRTFLYNVIFLDAFAKDGTYRYDPTIVSDGQWKTVPNPFGTQIATGNGAIGGRIRDCAIEGASGRPSWHIAEATVGFGTPPSKTGYFNALEEDTLPVPERSSTNILGRYVGLDVAPGPNFVTATILQGGAAVSLGGHPVYVLPSSLSVVSFPGVVPPVTHE
ncbi:MAG: hypothetical protein AMXMBFR64_14930 [Myxococcales bacterium]